MADKRMGISPKMEEVFGNLTFGGIVSTNKERVNGREAVVSTTYSLYSDIQRADEVEVTIPAGGVRGSFEYMDSVRLVNPKLLPDAMRIGAQVYGTCTMSADSMTKV